jgi:hypothetical protein
LGENPEKNSPKTYGIKQLKKVSNTIITSTTTTASIVKAIKAKSIGNIATVLN